MVGKTFDVIIVGAGIIGCSAAWEIARRGAKVLVLEKNDAPFQGASSAAFGSLTPYTDPFFNGDAREFASRAVDLYRRDWIDTIVNATGIDVSFTDSGLIQLCSTAEKYEKVRSHIVELQSAGFTENRLLSKDEVQELEPNLSSAFVGAALYDEPWFDVDAYFGALGKSLELAAVSLEYGVQVADISIQAKDVVVTATEGSSFKARSVVICVGAYPISIMGVHVFQLKWVRGDALGVYTRDDKPLLHRHVYMDDGFITPRKNGRMLLGTTYVPEVTAPDGARRDRITISGLSCLIESNTRLLPKLVDCDVGEMWRGWRPTATDELPILGPVDGNHNVIVATGFIGLGVTMAPAAAQCIGDYVVDNLYTFPEVFSPSRF